MKKFGTHHPLFPEFPWEQFQTGVALPEDRPLSGLLIQKDEGRLALAVADNAPVRIDPGPLHFLLLKLSGRVVADLAGVACFQAPAGAGSYGAGDLPAGKDFRD